MHFLMRVWVNNWLQFANEGLHQPDLALQWHLFGLAYLGLTVQLRS